VIAVLGMITQCVLPTAPVLATASVGELAASLTPGAVHLGERTATGCDDLPAPHPTAIASWRGELAVGFRDGGAWSWDGDRFTPLVGLPDAPVRALAAIGDTLWIGTGDGLWVMDPAAPRARRFAGPLGRTTITALARDAEALLVGVDPRGLWRVERGAGRQVSRATLVGCFAGTSPLAPGSCITGRADAPLHITALAEHRGRLVAGTFDDGVWERAATGWRRIPSPRWINALLADRDTLYAATAAGLYRRAGGDAFERIELGLPSDHVNDLAMHGGTLWLGTSRGVVGWNGRSVRVLDTGGGRIVYAVAVASDGAVWAGTIAGAIRFGTDGTRRYDRARGTLPGDWVTALLPDRDGAVLAGTYDSGVARLAPDGSAHPVPGLSGPLWVNPHGLARLGGSLVAATLGQGLRRAAGGSPRLPDNDVTAVLQVGATTWVGTRGGLARVR
jgi:ligand-binding sensor domain-containing protein